MAFITSIAPSASASKSNPAGPARPSVPGLRWWICGLLFFATTLNYLDRQSLSVLKEDFLTKNLSWRESDYGWILFSFQTAYALFQPFVGRIIDTLGVRASFAVAVVVWSCMAGAHSLVRSTIGFCTVRFFLGMAEAANFPASIKAVAQWYPQKERALATGIFNAGSNVGIMLAPFTVWLAATFGWRTAFIAIGALGFIWLFFWLRYYDSPETHKRLAAKESEYIRAGLPSEEKSINIPWTALLRQKEVWPFLIAKFLTDPVWWFYLYWLPPYLSRERGLSALNSAAMLIIPYVAADFGSIFGGWISGHMMQRGWRVGPARYLAMFIFAVCMPGAIVAALTSNFWLAMTLISIATASHQGWSANIFTTATDLFPSRVAGSVVGLGQTCGAIGGMLMTLLVGASLEWTRHNYVPVFIWAGLMHPLSLIIYRMMAGKDLIQTRMDERLDLSHRHNGLLLAGSLSTVFGAAMAAVIWLNWDYCVRASDMKSAAGGITAMILVALLGVILFNAGLAKKTEKPVPVQP